MKHENIEQYIIDNKKKVLYGTILSIDPSSGSKNSKPGYAWFEGGQLTDSGVLQVDHRHSVDKRLQNIYDQLAAIPTPDVMIVERIRGVRSHIFLHWAVGAVLAAVRCECTFEMPTSMWRKYAGKYHIKSDAMDAIAMGAAAITIAETEE